MTILAALVSLAGLACSREVLTQSKNSSALYVHLVPHSYNGEFLADLDKYFPQYQRELL